MILHTTMQRTISMGLCQDGTLVLTQRATGPCLAPTTQLILPPEAVVRLVVALTQDEEPSPYTLDLDPDALDEAKQYDAEDDADGQT